MRIVKEVVAFTPVYNEPARMVLDFNETMQEVALLLRPEVGMQHFFGNDGATSMPVGLSNVIVNHRDNQGLATTLVDGFEVLLNARPDADVLVRIDAQEHNPYRIPEIVEAFTATDTEALFLPVWYWWGDARPPERDIYAWVHQFWDALAPMDPTRIMEIFNQKFPLGYQVYRLDFLRRILPELKEGLEIFERQNQIRATWGLDLLIMLLAARDNREAIDFKFGGYAEPWKENRSKEKAELQAKKAKAMLRVAKALGCEVRRGMRLP